MPNSADAEDDILTRVRAFSRDTVAPAAAGWAMGQSPDAEHYRDAAKLGLFRLELPATAGGLGLGFALKARVCEALAAADFGFAMSVVNTHNVALRLCLGAPDALREKYLPGLLSGRISACTALTEPGAGSDFAAIATRAARSGNGWGLTGEKAWIVNGRHAGLAIVFAQCGTTGDASGIGAFLVDLTLPGVRAHAQDSAFSQTSIGTGGFVLDGVEVAEDHLLLEPGTAFKSILTEINGARAYVAAMCCGMLDAALSQAADYGETRRAFGKPLATHPGWRLALAEARTERAAARALTEEAIGCVAAGEDAQLVAAQAKLCAVRACQRHLPELLHAMGAAGLRPEYCFTRHLAAAQMAALTDGANALLRERVGRITRPATSTSRT